MKIITYYTLVFSTYYDQVVCQIKTDDEESSMYTPSEIQNILELWRMGELKGSFGVGTILRGDAIQRMIP